MGIFHSKEKAAARTYAPQGLRIMQESANIVKQTANPETFFSRLDLLLGTLQKLAEAERYVKFNGVQPSELLRVTSAEQQNLIADFVERYYDETRKKMAAVSTCAAKLKKANAFIDTLNLYADRMDAAVAARANALHSALVTQANAAPGQKIRTPISLEGPRS